MLLLLFFTSSVSVAEPPFGSAPHSTSALCSLKRRLIFAISAPIVALRVLQLQDLLVRPVKVIGNVRYLLVEPLYGVAPDPPRLVSSSSNCCSQCGHWVRTRLWPFSLIRR